MLWWALLDSNQRPSDHEVPANRYMLPRLISFHYVSLQAYRGHLTLSGGLGSKGLRGFAQQGG